MVEYSALIIDDDIWMQRILAQTVKSYGFKKVLLASNGFDGIALAVEHRPHIIISDILMPELNGHLVLRILKTIKLTKELPILMVSAVSDAENLGKAVKQGTAGFISKPFTRSTVFEKLIDVFGEEKLEKIKKGEEITDVDTFYTNTVLKTKSINDVMQRSENETKKEYSHSDEDLDNIENIKKMLFD